jgi:hypothetical protein
MHVASHVQSYRAFNRAEADCGLGAACMRSPGANKQVYDIVLSLIVGSDVGDSDQPYILRRRRCAQDPSPHAVGQSTP